MAEDVKIFDGTNWKSLVGPEGPTVVSADLVNVARLGTDGKILVAQADLDARYVNITGDTMTGQLIVQPPVGPSAPRGSVMVVGDNTNAQLVLQRNSAVASTHALRFVYTRGTTAAPLPPQALDVFGTIAWESIAADGVSRAQAGFVTVVCNKAPTTGDAFAFSTMTLGVGSGTSNARALTIVGGPAVYTGINWQTPTVTLEVGGDARVRGALEATGNITSAGTAHSFAASSIPASAVAPRPAILPTEAAYYLKLEDANATIINTTQTISVSIIIPDNATVPFPIGTRFEILDASAASTTIVQASATVTLQWNSNLQAVGQGQSGGAGSIVALPSPFSRCIIYKIATNSWVVIT